MFLPFIEQLKKRLQQPLPGEHVQFRMAPITRKSITPSLKENYNPVKSAVLILLFPVEKSIHTLLIQRNVYPGVHSAQIAFPGGKHDETDMDLKHTALRETHEEVGVHPGEVEVIGKLTDVYITPSNYIVSPYVGFLKNMPELIIDTHEVQQTICTDLFGLNRPEICSEKLIVHSGGNKVKTPYYEVEGLTVWGATAMMISELNVVAEESGKVISL